MDDEIREVRQDIAETRERISDTLEALEGRVTGVKEAVTRNVNPLPWVRENPWLAVAVAVGAGVAIGMSGADRKAAVAAKQGARKAGPAMRDGAKAAVAGVKGAFHKDESDEERATREAIAGNRLATYGGVHPYPEHEQVDRTSSTTRVLDAIRDRLDAQIADVTNQLLDASRQFLGTQSRRPSGI